jgi:16S rRNA (guanine966-N2)-methyltransferase
MNLFSPKGDVSRPITDRVKESLFNVLRKYGLSDLGSTPSRDGLVEKTVADLFCGIGSLGIESLSRGARFVTFVEKDPKIIAVLRKNIEKAGFIRESLVLRADAFKIGAPVNFIRRSFGEGREQKYDLIFVDPPYSATEDVGDGSRLSGLLNLLGEQSADDGFIVVRTHRRTELLERYGRLKVIERRQWGTMAVTILQRVAE